MLFNTVKRTNEKGLRITILSQTLEALNQACNGAGSYSELVL